MKEGYVVRRGRDRRVSDGEMQCRECCGQLMMPIFAAIFGLAAVGYLYSSESNFHNQQIAFAEVEDKVVELNDVNPSTLERISKPAIVHISGPYTATVEDHDFGVEVDGLKLSRHTEYCQWQQYSHTKCDTCKYKENGETKERKCNCVESYTYEKTWRNHRVVSVGFDQPVHHHNPQRDPFPSSSFVSSDAAIGPISISQPIVKNLRADMASLTFSWNARPIDPGSLRRFWQWLFGEPLKHYVSMEKLHRFQASRARNGPDSFIYTNTYDGWFFSPYMETWEKGLWGKILLGAGKFLEGSLLDWQLGDLWDMAQGCKAGDIRTRYHVSEAASISMVAELTADAAQREKFRVFPYRASNNFDIGIIHAGYYSSGELFRKETSIAHTQAFWARVAVFGFGICVMYLLVRFGVWPESTDPGLSYVGGAFGFSLLALSAVWLVTYGLSDWGGWDTDAWTILMAFVGAVTLHFSVQKDDYTKAKKYS